MLLSRHVHTKCFPFKGATLTDDTLVSEPSDTLLSATSIALCGNTAATRSSAGVVPPLLTLRISQGSHGPVCFPGAYFETPQVFIFCGLRIFFIPSD